MSKYRPFVSYLPVRLLLRRTRRLKTVSRPQRNLTLYNVTEKSAGLYFCSATNENVRMDVPTVLVVTGVVPSFRGADSYLAFPTLLNTYLELNVEVHFKPESADGTRNSSTIFVRLLSFSYFFYRRKVC